MTSVFILKFNPEFNPEFNPLIQAIQITKMYSLQKWPGEEALLLNRVYIAFL